MQETQVLCLGQEDPLEKEMATHSSTLAWKISWIEEPGTAVQGVAKSRTWLSNFTFTFHFHASEKEMATHSSTLAWKIPWMEEPGRLQSMGLQRVTHDWATELILIPPIAFVFCLLKRWPLRAICWKELLSLYILSTQPGSPQISF